MKSERNAAPEILAHLQKAATSLEDGQIIVNLSEAFAAVVRGHGVGQIPGWQRDAIVAALIRAEDTARSALPAHFSESSLHQGCLAIFGLVNAWAKPVGSPERREAAPAGLPLMVRMIANNLDTLCASMEMARLLPPAVSAQAIPLADMRLSATAH
ncbi:hypothetical protein ACLBWX_00970 [Methylobacterium sp. M6A4_1b]